MKVRTLPFKSFLAGLILVWTKVPDVKSKYLIFEGDGSVIGTMRYLLLLAEFVDTKGLEFDDSTEKIFVLDGFDAKSISRLQQFIETLNTLNQKG